ncbi:hypothetical protein [Actinosynnema sp. NPDC020468]
MPEPDTEAVPVVDGGGRRIGVVSRHDLLTLFVRPDELLAPVEPADTDR